MWDDVRYCWVVVCKNHWFHRRRNFFSGHKIPLGEAAPFAPCPVPGPPFHVRCEECVKVYLYDPIEVVRVEYPLSDAFTPHPLFEQAKNICRRRRPHLGGREKLARSFCE